MNMYTAFFLIMVVLVVNIMLSIIKEFFKREIRNRSIINRAMKLDERYDLPTGWLWNDENQELVYSHEGIVYRGLYNGGLVDIINTEGQAFYPKSIPKLVLNQKVLLEGEVAYEPYESWIYVGNGKKFGGLKVLSKHQVDANIIIFK